MGCRQHIGWLGVGGGLFVLTVVTVFTAAAGTVRHAGLLQSINPWTTTLVIEEMGRHGRIDLVEISFQNAEVVRVSRNPVDPWHWRERHTDIYRWPIGTFVVITGKRNSSGAIEACRVEIPKVPPD